MTPRREQAKLLLEAYLPSEAGCPAFGEIAKDFGGRGTTCGYLTGWLLWKLGCRDNRIVNRLEPLHGLTYGVGQNLARLVLGGKGLGAWRTLAGGARPQLGDCLYFAVSPPKIRHDGSKDYQEHVAIAIDCTGDQWVTADAGRTSPKTGRQRAEYVTRTFDPKGRTLTFAAGPRLVVGWIDLDAVPMEPLPEREPEPEA